MLQSAEKRQLGAAWKVYSGAMHVRFEHGIDTQFLTSEWSLRQDIPFRERRHLMVAALLHDIGHYPFSHAPEEFIPAQYKHEKVLQQVLRQGSDFGKIDADELIAVLERHDIDRNLVADMLSGDHPLGVVLDSDLIDMDRLSYTRLDLVACRAGFGVDTDRILSEMTFEDGRLGVRSGGAASIADFVGSTVHAYERIYHHPRVHTFEVMLRYALRADPEFSGADHSFYSRIHGMSEGVFLEHLLHNENPFTADLVRRFAGSRSLSYQTVYKAGGSTCADADEAVDLARALTRAEGEILARCDERGFLMSMTPAKRMLKRYDKPLPDFCIDGARSIFTRPDVLGNYRSVPEEFCWIYSKEGTAQDRLDAAGIIADVMKEL